LLPSFGQHRNVTQAQRTEKLDWQIIYCDTQPERRFKELHGPRGSHAEVRLATVFLSGEMQLAGMVLPTKILKPTQTGNKPFVNVNGCVAYRGGAIYPFLTIAWRSPPQFGTPISKLDAGCRTQEHFAQ
jgi:hypothetical protein